MYNYRIGEQKNIGAEVDQINDPSRYPQVASATVRLYNSAGVKIWERTAVVDSNTVKYLLTDITTKGQYSIQWVISIGSEMLFSDLMKLQVKTANEV
jgi:hypothetical protein